MLKRQRHGLTTVNALWGAFSKISAFHKTASLSREGINKKTLLKAITWHSCLYINYYSIGEWSIWWMRMCNPVHETPDIVGTDEGLMCNPTPASRGFFHSLNYDLRLQQRNLTRCTKARPHIVNEISLYWHLELVNGVITFLHRSQRTSLFQ